MTHLKSFLIIFSALMTARCCIYGHVLTRNYNNNDNNDDRPNDRDIYMNQFAVRVTGGRDAADRVASKHGFVNLGQIGSLKDYYLFEHHRISKRSTDHSAHHHSLLESDPNVGWFQQQVELKRRKRDLFEQFRNYPLSSSSYLRSQFLANGPSYNFPDPLYPEQWYLREGAAGGYDMNVVAAWQKGYTGRGVVVSILDDGIQTNHPDLVQNYDRYASTDINGNDDDPMPQDNGDNKHGTRCAGEVAATAYNGVCGVGIAFNASIGGVRMLDGTVNDAVEAQALSHNPGHIDIYSASWGPEDDGKTVDGPGRLARQAFVDGVNHGRQGKGSIFVWASGNGGRHDDNCNCDGYTNSIYTLSISSATQHGLKPWYLEECSSTLATTYSSGTPGQDRSVVTVDMDMALDHDQMCTKEHTGTSASAPIAAAICALALEANPHLTWRDMQYIVVLTSKSAPLEKDGWITNGVQRKVSHKFGYGLMDAGAMVALAERWKTVPPQRICEMPPDTVERMIPNEYGASVEFYLDTDGCYGTHRSVNYLEHVQAKITLNFNPRGNLRIILQSPAGTSSTLLFPRPRDTYKSSFDDWPFLSVHFWGERPTGRWRLTIVNAGTKPVMQPGVLKQWSLVFYGTETDPLRQGTDPTPLGPSSFMPFAASSVSYTAVLPKQGDSQKSNQSDNDYDSKSSKDCHEECSGGCSGSGPDQCASCRHLTMYSGSRKICLHECPDGWYAIPQQVCYPCHDSCQTCSAGTGSDCLTCRSSHLLLREGDATKCTTECPVGFFEARSTACNPCSSLCARCEDVPDRCTHCREGLVLYNKTCMAVCPRTTYNDGNGSCNSCQSSCATCIGPKATDCVTCPSHLFHLNGTCIESCPNQYYLSRKSNECYSCNPTCKTCTADRCSSCWPGWTLDDRGQCKPTTEMTCAPGTYLDGVKCLQCHVSCQSCTGPSFSQCSSCFNNKYLYRNTCIDQCPKWFYADKQGGCSPCDHTCATCDDGGADRCTSCADGFHLEGNECSTGCPEGEFKQDGRCVRCHSTCQTCKGVANDSCTGCYPGRSLVQGACWEDCAVGHFRRRNSCVACHPRCRTCTGDGPFDCSSCLPNHVLDGGLCMECGHNQYYDPVEEKCGQCNASCSTCNGPDAFSCLSCLLPLKHDPLLHRCVPCCNRQLTNNCCHCDSHTDSCISIPSANKRRIEEEIAQNYERVAHRESEDSAFLTHGILTPVIAGCLLVIVIFFVVFGILQARSRKYFFQSKPSGYQRVPVQYLDFRSPPQSKKDDEETLLPTST